MLPKYTIDLNSLLELFRPERGYYKERFVGLWRDITKLIEGGRLVSHAEVLREIENNGDKEDELRKWATLNKEIFLPHASEETIILAEISRISSGFMSRKDGSEYADPWIIAQAHVNGFILITEERLQDVHTNPRNYKIPLICQHLNPVVECINIRKLIDKEDWRYE